MNGILVNPESGDMLANRRNLLGSWKYVMRRHDSEPRTVMATTAPQSIQIRDMFVVYRGQGIVRGMQKQTDEIPGGSEIQDHHGLQSIYCFSRHTRAIFSPTYDPDSSACPTGRTFAFSKHYED